MLTVNPKIQKKVAAKEYLRLAKNQKFSFKSVRFIAPKLGRVGDFGKFLIKF